MSTVAVVILCSLIYGLACIHSARRQKKREDASGAVQEGPGEKNGISFVQRSMFTGTFTINGALFLSTEIFHKRKNLKWSITSWYLRNFVSVFLFWIQEEKFEIWMDTLKPQHCGLRICKSVLGQSRDKFMAHNLDTQSSDWLFDWPDQNTPASSLTCTFYPHGHSIMDLDQSNFVERKYHSKTVFFVFWAVLVSRDLLLMMKKRIVEN